MNLEANLFPRYELRPEDTRDFGKVLSELPQMERFFNEAPLGQNAVVTLAATEFDSGRDELEVLENYQFVITRRYTFHGELHVGGANGEILNVYTFISGLRTFLEEQKALAEHRED
jgi:hypothetical protein